jgi:hypothetical protein
MPEPLNPEQLTDEQLERKIRDLLAEAAPLEAALSKLRVQLQQVASEQKKRERTHQMKTRMQVRTTVKEGQLPSLQQIAESSNELVPSTSLSSLRFFRDSGTEVGLGYATSRESSVWMTNGSNTLALKTVNEIRSLYLEGWEFGTVAHRGVRIHIPNSRTEKVLPAAEVFVKVKQS